MGRLRRRGRRRHRRVRTAGVVAVVVGIVSTVFVGTALTATAAPARRASSTVGAVTLTQCASAPVTYCGHLAVPLDRSDPGSPRIPIAFRWYPAAAPPGGVAAGTVVPVEGGPGYPSVGSVKGGYDIMYGPLLQSRNMLAVDLRGTGGSAAVDCPPLQHAAGQLSGPGFAAAAAACGTALDHHWRDRAGRWIQASDLFTSAQAAADVAEVLRALALPPVDLYGDSYGSWFAQVFADRYPQLVRSVILDSTYSTVSIDPWYRSSHDSMPANVDAACLRSPQCADAETQTPWRRIVEVAELLQSSPVAGTVPDGTGHLAPVTMGPVGLVDLVNDAAGDPLIYRALDAAARALVLALDPAPLLRLYAQRLAVDEEYTGIPATSYSGGLYLAVSCVDYPQIFPMSVSPADRAADLAAAEVRLDPRTFAPFTVGEWVAQDQNTETYSACTGWPTPTAAVPPTTGALPLLPASLPVLVLGGEFDSWTPPVDVPRILREIGGHQRFVELANSTHVVGEGDQPCGSTLIQAFVRTPGALDSMDVSCASAVPPIRSVGSFPESLAQVAAARPTSGNRAAPDALRLAAAAVATAGDAVARAEGIGTARDAGLHGGTVRAHAGAHGLELRADQLVPGVAVTGTVTTGAGVVTARLRVAGPGGRSVEVDASWPSIGVAGAARISGTAGGRVLVGTCPAP
jgi:pimeloyl-ACP methyl ester carboxylesterase